MARYPFATVDVFTDVRFGGNPLAVFTDARGLADAQMQALAAEMNLSETTFVLPPRDAANTAQVRIFTRTAELPFAGHPNVGTAYVLAQLRGTAEAAMRFEEPAGVVEVRPMRDATGVVVGASIDAPQPLRVPGELAVAPVAACIGLDDDDVRTQTHAPLRATVGVEFVLVEVGADALARATPHPGAMRRLAAACPGIGADLAVFVYARSAHTVIARMFAPLSGTWEDPATGSAHAALGALLLSRSQADELTLAASQGTEIGRPSALIVEAWRLGDDCYASVAGRCVPVLTGVAEV